MGVHDTGMDLSCLDALLCETVKLIVFLLLSHRSRSKPLAMNAASQVLVIEGWLSDNKA
jgi:hypothetical protein